MAELQRWYAARAKPGQERIALENLSRQQFVAYFPTAQIRRSHRGRSIRESRPVFPGYVLIQFILDIDRWQAINGTRGIIRLLSFCESGRPTPLPHGEIEALQEREKRGELCIFEDKRPRRGDLVKVKVGWATDRIGTVIHSRGERIKFLLSLLGRKVEVMAPAHALEIVGKQKPARTLAPRWNGPQPAFLTKGRRSETERMPVR